jgi:hypothetical protein
LVDLTSPTYPNKSILVDLDSRGKWPWYIRVPVCVTLVLLSWAIMLFPVLIFLDL